MNSSSRRIYGRAVPVPLALLLAALAAGCGTEKAPRSESARPVKSMIVVAGGETQVRSFPGKVEASKKAELAFQVSGLLTTLSAAEGQRVAENEVIAQLRPDEFEARLKTLQGQLDQARAALRALQSGERPEQIIRLESQVRAAAAKLANARAVHGRNSELKQRNALSRHDFELSDTNYRVAEEEHEAARQMLEKGAMAREEDIEAQEAEVRGLEGRVVEARIQLDDTTLRAPYDGVIAQRFVEANQTIQAGAPIVKFQDVDEVDIIVDVPETVMSAGLRSADILELSAEFSGARGVQFPVRIKEISQRADPTTQTFPVRVSMEAPTDINILPGMTATVTLTYRRASVLDDRIQVPISAIYKDSAGEQLVWIIGSDEVASRRAVQVGQPEGGQIEITSGLQSGDRIAVAGVTHLREGMQVRDLGDALGGAR